MSEISIHIRHCIFYQFQLKNNTGAAALIYVLHWMKALLRIALVEISLKDFVKVICQWKIVRGPNVLDNLILNE